MRQGAPELSGSYEGGIYVEQERRAIRIGLAVISFAVIWKLLGGGLLGTAMASFRDPETAAFLLYLETGRAARAAEPQAAETTPPIAETETAAQQATKTAASFTAEDAQLVELINASGYGVDVEALLEQSLSWDLTDGEPAVLILHTHATESYTKTNQSYTESSAFRTLDEQYNMVRVGDRLAELLESYGISVLHDRTLHDYPSYTGSYGNSRQTVQRYLEQYPSIRIVLDIHRDAVELSDGSQLRTSATVNGTPSAQLMLVVGTDAGGLNHAGWRENMALAVKLCAQLEKQWPGITRPVYLRTERFNQDLLPGALLVEVGAAGNTLEEALTAAEVLAQAIAAMAYGANTG